MKTLSKIYTGLILLFLFAPIVILIIFSFNGINSTVNMSGFSLKWYGELFRNKTILTSLRNTLVLAVTAALISTVMGTAAAVGIYRLRSRYLRAALDSATNIPMINPDIITGVSLMLMFVFVGNLLRNSSLMQHLANLDVFSGSSLLLPLKLPLKVIGVAAVSSSPLNFATILIAHVTFCLPYVILQVLPKLQQMDKSLPEAAMDLGCRPVRAFFKVEVPEILPGILTGMIMAFTMSLDDFVISYFTSGPGFQTLPVLIYSMTKKTVKPTIYALATIIFFVILTLLTLTNLIDSDTDKAMKEARKKKKLKKQQNKEELT